MKKTLVQRDLTHLWHPFTQMKDCRAFPPIPIKCAKGIRLYDYAGNSYYDTISSWWCNVHGHGHPVIKNAIKKQLDSLEHVLFAGFTHEPAVKLAEELLGIAPKNLKKVFYSDNGSTAVEVAMKMSVQYWRNTGKRNKNMFLSLDAGYHGDTLGAMSLSGRSSFNEKFSDIMMETLKAPSPYCYRCPLGLERSSCDLECAGRLEQILHKNKNRLAALFLEPLVMCAGGMIVYPAEYLKRAASAAKKNGVHLILDEVATGFGRTGKMFASEHAGIEPDMMCLSKGITSGYLPLGVTLATKEIYDAFYGDFSENKTFFHGHTFTANPLACAAAIASLSIFKKEKTLSHVPAINKEICAFLDTVRDLPIVGDTRQIGVIGALELVSNKRKKTPFKPERRVGREIYLAGLKRGLILRPLGDIIYFFLPLVTTPRELDEIFSRTLEILQNVSD